MNQFQAQKIIELNQQTYDLIANNFSATRDRPWPEMQTLIKKYVKNYQNILDLGCGNGRLLELIKNYKINYLAIDSSKKLINQALKHLDNKTIKHLKAEFKYLNILNLSQLQPQKFNIIFMFAVFNHIPSKKIRLLILQHIKKLLKPNGLLIMTNWNLWNIKYKKNIWNYKLLKHSNIKSIRHIDINSLGLGFKDIITIWQSSDKQKYEPLYYRAFTKFELKKLLRQSGFKIIENYYSYNNQKTYQWKGKNIVSIASPN